MKVYVTTSSAPKSGDILKVSKKDFFKFINDLCDKKFPGFGGEVIIYKPENRDEKYDIVAEMHDFWRE